MRITHKDLHLLVQTVVHDETVAHSYPCGFHWMAWPVMVVSNVGIKKVADPRRLVVAARRALLGNGCHERLRVVGCRRRADSADAVAAAIGRLLVGW